MSFGQPYSVKPRPRWGARPLPMASAVKLPVTRLASPRASRPHRGASAPGDVGGRHYIGAQRGTGRLAVAGDRRAAGALGDTGAAGEPDGTRAMGAPPGRGTAGA